MRIVKVRATAMQSASQLVAGGMIKVHFGASGKVGKACHLAQVYCREQLQMADCVCGITTYLYPGCKIISGNREVLFPFVSLSKFNVGITRRHDVLTMYSYVSKISILEQCNP